jgi:zinc-binding in reverse transcriptase
MEFIEPRSLLLAPPVPRIIIFAWVMTRNRIITIDNLNKRDWPLINMCILCRSAKKNVHHLFNDCILFQLLWLRVQQKYRLLKDHNSIPSFYISTRQKVLMLPVRHSKMQKLLFITIFILEGKIC